MDTSRNRLAMLAVLVAVLASVIWWQFGGSPATVAPSATTAPQSGRQQGTSARSDAAPPVPVVALARLGEAGAEPSDTGRDPFRFATKAPGSGRATAGTAPPVAPALPAFAGPVVPAGPPPPPPIPLKFIGVASRRAGVRIAMLTDGRGVYYGSEGSIIEGQYRIVRIGLDSIEMTYLDGRGRRTIPLSGG